MKKNDKKKASPRRILCLLMAATLMSVPLIPAMGGAAAEDRQAAENADSSSKQGSYYEAENGVLGGQAVISNLADASGGKVVGYLGGDSNKGTVTIGDITVEESGLYEVILYYATGDERSFTVSVNGGEATTLTCAATGGFDKVGSTTMLVRFKSGSNTVTFGSNGWAPDLDRIFVPGEPRVSTEDTRMTYQAEDAKLSGSAAADNNAAACSGGGKVKGIGKDGSVLFDQISIEQSSIYAIDVAYCTKDGGSFLITVDGAQELRLDCPAGYSADVPNRHILTCELESGVHTIQFTGADGDAPDLDEIRIYPCQVYETESYTFLFDKQTGRYNLLAGGRTRISDAYASVKVGETLYRSIDYTQHEITQESLEDDLGTGHVLRVVNKKDGCPVLEQTFRLYEGKNYFLTDTQIYWESGETIGTNYIVPLSVSSLGGVENEMNGQDYFLRVPYDNDGWVKYELSSINGSDTGYEVAAILDEVTGKALVMGSLSHDTWKTGITYIGSQNQIDELYLYGGANGTLTRDQSPHGTVSDQKVSSPLMFVGFYEDWQSGMDEFAKANTVVTPAKTDGGGVPFGWNSWGSVQSDINLNTANKISDYIAKNLQDSWKTAEGDVVYVVLDSYWDNLSDTQLKSFVKHCKENGQEAGIYWAPFVSWHSKESLASSTVEGSNGVRYQDIILKKADGSYYGNDLDGAFPIDMTHPAAQARVDYFIDRFKSAGFTYIKLDFLVHGALEGSRYDSSIQTGTQAYNFGMQYVTDRLDGQMFVNLSIAPTFPYQYANGKRIACDAYYSINDTQYTLNGLTYGFWQKQLYQYPDPDHIVIWGKDGGASAAEARSRITSGILLGTSFLTGDNFIDPQGKKTTAEARFKDLLTNPGILEIAKTGKIFHPVSVSHKNTASNLFWMTDGEVSYLAVLNYGSSTYKADVDLSELFELPEGYAVKELWSGEYEQTQDGVLSVRVSAKDARVYRIGIADETTDPDVPDETDTPDDPTPAPDNKPEIEPSGKRNPAALVAGIAGAAVVAAAAIATVLVLIRKKRSE